MTNMPRLVESKISFPFNLFSPCGILCVLGWLRHLFIFFAKNLKFCWLQFDVRWEMVACGKTRDQLELTEQAHLLLNIGSPGIKSRGNKK